MPYFDVQIAIEDKGSCGRQKVSCESCEIGEALGRAGDELCPHDVVYSLATLIDKMLSRRIKQFGEGMGAY